MVRLAEKAFYPAKPPFPLLHVDTTWKFREMYKLRDEYVGKELGFKLIVHVNEEGRAQGINPITHGSKVHTDVMKTQALRQALDKYRFDAAFGGARRDEEKSRAKERVFSFRDEFHRWDPKNQRPELWNLYNTKVRKGESIRVFPLSNWTELDVWQYIHLENIPIVPLYFAAERPIVWRDGVMIMVDDDRLPLKPGEQPEMRRVRFRTLGCYPLSGAVDSAATTLPEIIQEMLLTTFSERQGRLIERDRLPTDASDDFTISDTVLQLRYRWELAPLSELFVVYNRGGRLLSSDPDDRFGDLFADSLSRPFGNLFVMKLRYRLGS
jgi:sulfate adenylyltransferase subunit 2